MRVGLAKLEKGIDSNFHFSYTIWRLSLFWLLFAPLTITRFLVIMCLKGDSVYGLDTYVGVYCSILLMRYSVTFLLLDLRAVDTFRLQCSGVVNVRSIVRTEVWMMKEYGLVESWTKLCSMDILLVIKFAWAIWSERGDLEGHDC